MTVHKAGGSLPSARSPVCKAQVKRPAAAGLVPALSEPLSFVFSPEFPQSTPILIFSLQCQAVEQTSLVLLMSRLLCSRCGERAPAEERRKGKPDVPGPGKPRRVLTLSTEAPACPCTLAPSPSRPAQGQGRPQAQSDGGTEGKSLSIRRLRFESGSCL